MNVKEYLKQYKILTGKVRRYEERIEQIEASLQRSMDLDGLPKSTKTSDPTKETAIKLATIHEKMSSAVLEAEMARQLISDQIELVSRHEYRELLYSRYILLLPWEDVTDRVSIGRKERYDVKHIMGYMHAEALRAFGEVIK